LQKLCCLSTQPCEISSLIVRRFGSLFRHSSYEVRDLPNTEGSHKPEMVSWSNSEEIHPCLMYYQDKLSDSGIERSMCSSTPVGSGRTFLALKVEHARVQSRPFTAFPGAVRGGPGQSQNIVCPSLGLAMGNSEMIININLSSRPFVNNCRFFSIVVVLLLLG
jgi:hypothetical protein